ncbi:tyrosine-type recombinase/integrase [Photobacterium sp. TY1-4]|uniref:phage integrase n=1 Tax=Photobacterium sp. TY1-4 TaxID=2899122 RepID=UPI0021BF3FE1|nr:tyrosine-type recombinase/integrase [Photobacterium sp. TY1-4]UXI00462.1 tyrosine-type recombinase/integrase [Photobacterium sp. TY1-4]
MSVRNLKDGSKKPWLCDCYPNGRNGNRVRKRFATKGEALAYEKYLLKETEDKPWLGDKPERRSLLDMIHLWHRRHGQALAHAKYTLRKLEVMAHGMGDPIYTQFTAKMFTEYREKRLAGEIPDLNHRKVAVSLRTCNNEQDLLNAVIVELIRMEEWKGPNPLTTVRQFKLHEQEMDFLTTDEIRELLVQAKSKNAHRDMLKVIKISLATGARFQEVASLTGAHLSKFKITFTKTKGKKNRTVPISPELYQEIYKEGSEPLFSIGYSTAYRFIVKHVPRLEGQSFHVLRHTFASHFMMNGGNIIVLQRILGHSDIKQTMRYAHFAPDHLEDAVTKNPLSRL